MFRKNIRRSANYCTNLIDLICFDAAGGSDGGSGGTGGGNDDPPKPNDVVPREQFDRLMDQKKAADAKLRAIEEDKRKAVEEEARKTGDVKKLLELKEAELEAEKAAAAKAKEEADEMKARELDSKKFSAFITGVGASIDKKYLPLVEIALDKIAVDQNGNLDPASVAKVVSDFQKEYPAILTKPGTGNTPNLKPEGGTIGANPWDSGGRTTRQNLKERKAGLAEAVAKYRKDNNMAQ